LVQQLKFRQDNGQGVEEGAGDGECEGEAKDEGEGDGDRLIDAARLRETLAETEREELVDGSGDCDGVIDKSAQSLAMKAATCACDSACAKMRTLSRSPM
jgi:hypothetical protein